MSPISVRGVAVASATAVTAVGAVVGMSTGDNDPQSQNVHTAEAADSTLLANVPTGAEVHTVSDNMARQAESQQVAADAAAKKKAEEARRKAAELAHKKAEAKKKAEAEAKKKAEEAKKAKEAAERAAKKKKEQEKAASTASTGSSPTVTGGSPQAMAKSMMSSSQFACFSNIVSHESGWNPTATNPSSGAYGLVQALPGNKMASVGSDWKTNPATQIKWGLNYMNSRYGSPCGAWSFWQSHHAY